MITSRARKLNFERTVLQRVNASRQRAASDNAVADEQNLLLEQMVDDSGAAGPLDTSADNLVDAVNEVRAIALAASSPASVAAAVVAGVSAHEAASNPHPAYLTQSEGDLLYQSLVALSESIDDRVAALLVAGTNITLTYDDGLGTLTIAATGGGGGLSSSVTAQVDFGARGSYAEVVVAAPWVTALSKIAVTPLIPTTADHGPQDALLEQLCAAPVMLDPGVGFTLGVYAPNGSWGRYDFECREAA